MNPSISSPALFVTWRSPKSRAVLPVGRVAFLPDQKLYEFLYIRAVESALGQGFLPFLEFPDLHQRYLSEKPFPLVANRLMPPGRPDYHGFLSSLGLSESAHPMEILARSQGQRATDQIALFPVPVPDSEGCYCTHCLVQAIRYMPSATQERIEKLKTDEKLFIMWDVQNPVDPHAISLRTEDNHMLGYLPAYMTGDAWKLTRDCGSLDVRVAHVNAVPAEAHHRLLVRVTACWPQGFRPFASEQFEPLTKP